MTNSVTKNKSTDQSSNNQDIWLNAVAVDKSTQIAGDLIKQIDVENKAGQEMVEKPKVDNPLAEEPMEPTAVVPMEEEVDPTKKEQQDLTVAEQMLVERLDDMVAILADIRDSLAASAPKEDMEMDQMAPTAEDVGVGLSQALLSALTITDNILAKRK